MLIFVRNLRVGSSPTKPTTNKVLVRGDLEITRRKTYFVSLANSSRFEL